MIKQVLTTSLISLGIGYVCEFAQSMGQSQYLNDFLKGNLITLLVALLAINSATMGIVLTKIRDLIDKKGLGSENFQSTKQEMLLSIKEQIGLIIFAVALLTIGGSDLINQTSQLKSGYWVLINSIFAYSMIVLYDTAKSVIIIIDYE
ncbi:hypothetical protein PFL02_52370 [Pseudomonas fluorescens]|uniref:hypothetical protein n=1 Tax=Pseudomonas protegens TaxID=380021 RepID=UPI00098D05EE|nr:hypothetical protein [Pseudomonas protegens]GED78387.1 hypothetical protein PFL02_52370 [Pseudomonas fluorescens]